MTKLIQAFTDNRINDIRYINRHFEEVNAQLKPGDLFVGYFETFSARRARMSINKVFFLRTIYFGFEFLFKRVLPKIKYLNYFYFRLTKGKNRLLSKAEVLGRLVCCGFEINEVESINGLVYFCVFKKQVPEFIKNKNYGLFFKMKRVGKGGKPFYVYKIRTMHPFSEFLQEYMMIKHGFSDKGKLNNDFRLTPWGKTIRRYWIDELPQVYNMMKGQMKLVGVRPVSIKYYEMVPDALKNRRNKYKPGCIPPYLALNAKPDVDSVLSSEQTYLDAKDKNPRTTDLKYFFYAIYNIVFKSLRSK